MIQFQPSNLEVVKARFTALGLSNVGIEGDTVTGQMPRERIGETLKLLRDDPALDFKFFTDMTAVDYSKYSIPQAERFAMVYILLSPSLGVRAELTSFVPESNPTVDSISHLFTAANWAEREVFDMYGIRFDGHPDLKRLLTPEDYEGYPLRKDYPLKGRGERASFPVYRGTPGHN